MKPKNNNRIPLNLPHLQNYIKKDPIAYEEEFRVQYRHYESVLQILMFNPSYFDKEFESLVIFLAHTCPSYKQEKEKFPDQMINLLCNYSTSLNRASRFACCKALVILTSKNYIELGALLPLFFELSKCQDKQLRKYLKQNIISHVKNINKKSRNEKINKEIQHYLFKILDNQQQETPAKMALEIIIELYKKNVWRNNEVVNQIANMCLSRSIKLLMPSLHFFLGSDDVDIEEQDSSDDEEERLEAISNLKKNLIANRFNKDTRKRQKLLDKVKKTVKKNEKEKMVETFNFSAIHLIYDPQSLAEKLLDYLQKTQFDVKLMLINFISRLIGTHELILLDFYPQLINKLDPHEYDVTRILQYTAQSIHKNVPPNEIEPLLRKITDKFVNEKNSTEAITVGLNSIREICARNPLVMNEDLLQDLVQYQKYKNKNVSIAAKSLVYLFRIKAPELLARKDRGKPMMATADLRAPQYGETNAVSYLPGAEALNESTGSTRSSLKRTHSMMSLEDDFMEVDDDSDEMEISDYETASSEEDDDDNSDDDHQSDEEDLDEEDEEEEGEYDNRELIENISKLRPEDAKRKAETISTDRILTTKEIRKVKATQMAKQLLAAQPKRMTRKDETTKEVIEDTLNRNDRVRLTDIERIYKKPKHDKESRLATVIDGRDGREKFGVKKPKMNENASTSNRDKRRNKAFGMIKHKLKRHKKGKTFHEKHLEMKQKLLNRERAKR